ncbi:HAMP domain-containing histidine kinase [Novosphingobium sp. KA1]|uniref:HAMP domain-containing histidine kinase n=1 Tax=Novosphingobium sp. (strain KA1) TaxID=164608 RepID=UPI001A8D1D95|nr:HAMP domain-containing histidine kinase [Novosphingobium sp. KA1]QSR18150.1 histidine kinase [Novosphingobium sp. KA1]
MHFDDRLATVLQLPNSSAALARIQYRQLVDILGRLPGNARSWAVAAGFAQLAQLDRTIPAADRARLVSQPLQPLTNPRLLAHLAETEPAVATAAVRCAQLTEEAWLALVPALPVRARGILRHRSDLGVRVDALLEQLGVQDRALPPAEALELDALLESPPAEAPPVTAPPAPAMIRPIPRMPSAAPPPVQAPAPRPAPASPATRPGAPAGATPTGATPAGTTPAPFAEFEQAAASLGTPPPPTNTEAGIGAIVRRIEEFRKAREAQVNGVHHAANDAGYDAPRLPLGDTAAGLPRIPAAIDFATDSEGRVSWADGVHAPSLIGMDLTAADAAVKASAGIASSLRHRVPLRGAQIEISGAPAVQGTWQVDAVPRFEPASGRFTGYCGRLRRPAALAAVGAAMQGHGEADRLRQILHELRTPANAIQVAAEIIQQQLYGPAPHEYRALAAAIAGDCAHILAGFEELDRLVRLETGALNIEAGECDLAPVLTETVNRLKAWTQPRRSGFALQPPADGAALMLPLDRAETERLLWRLLAALAGSTAPDEMLPLAWSGQDGRITLSVGLPAALAALNESGLPENAPGERGHALSTGMFGLGFTLRLAAAEASAAGGGLQREGGTIRLWLPGLTAASAGHSQGLNNLMF